MDDKRFEQKVAKLRKKKLAAEREAKRNRKPDYDAQYRTDEWQELRERIIQRDNFRCVSCGRKAKTYHVHHLIYQKGRRIWDVPDFYLVTLCPRCHKTEHSKTFIVPPRHFRKK